MDGNGLSSALEQCAIECALRRRHKRCRYAFRSMACNSCGLFIESFVDTDRRHIDLFMRAAEMKADAMIRSTNRYHPIYIAALLFCLLGAYLTYKPAEKKVLPVPKELVEDTDFTIVEDALTEVRLQKMMALNPHLNAMGDGFDLGDDGIFDCWESAIIFYWVYEKKQNCRIIRNDNPITGWTHLFNQVKVNGIWYDIEPQKVNQYFMTDTWGDKYNPEYNKNWTIYYAFQLVPWLETLSYYSKEYLDEYVTVLKQRGIYDPDDDKF